MAKSRGETLRHTRRGGEPVGEDVTLPDAELPVGEEGTQPAPSLASNISVCKTLVQQQRVRNAVKRLHDVQKHNRQAFAGTISLSHISQQLVNVVKSGKFLSEPSLIIGEEMLGVEVGGEAT